VTAQDPQVRISGGWPRPERDLVEAFARYPVANIADAMDRLGVCAGAISPVWAGARCAGPALPILTTAGDNAAIIEVLDHIEPGDIVVVNGLGYEDRALIGENLSERFAAAGAAGAVIDGAVRDRAAIEKMSFPVFARAVTPAGPFKNGPGVIGESVAVGGVVAAPGDIVVADEDGVAVIAQGRAPEILERAAAVAEREAALAAEMGRYS
jgi:regulator of RNase E activity RraA